MLNWKKTLVNTSIRACVGRKSWGRSRSRCRYRNDSWSYFIVSACHPIQMTLVVVKFTKHYVNNSQRRGLDSSPHSEGVRQLRDSWNAVFNHGIARRYNRATDDVAGEVWNHFTPTEKNPDIYIEFWQMSNRMVKCTYLRCFYAVFMYLTPFEGAKYESNTINEV